MIVCDGQVKRGFRESMFNPELNICGVATKFHKEHQTMIEIVYVNKLIKKTDRKLGKDLVKKLKTLEYKKETKKTEKPLFHRTSTSLSSRGSMRAPSVHEKKSVVSTTSS